MLLNIVRRSGIDVSERWYDVAYGNTNDNSVDEVKKAIELFYSDFGR